MSDKKTIKSEEFRHLMKKYRHVSLVAQLDAEIAYQSVTDHIDAALNAQHVHNALIDVVSGCKTEIKDGEIVQTILSREDIYFSPEPKEK